jgi:hypothetical protein
MTGLHLLKHMKGLSDEETCAAWLENPYFQAFCGESHFQHRLPFDRSSMTRWRRRRGGPDVDQRFIVQLCVSPAVGFLGRTDLRVAGSMPQVGQGLREPVAQRTRLPQTGVYPPHAAKTLFKLNNFPDRL